MTYEKSLIIIKPDAIQRNLVGEVFSRLERKGLKIIGTKMMSLENAIIEEHYAHIKDKPFFPGIRDFMKETPEWYAVNQSKDEPFAVITDNNYINIFPTPDVNVT